jgi:hypothetical protein
MAAKTTANGLVIVPSERIERSILVIRGQKVLLDRDLAALYGVRVKQLNQAVKRNLERFPADFAFRLTWPERREVVTICDHLAQLKYSPVLPYAFTEHGAVMAATILNSPLAVRASILVVRAFVRMRQLLAGNEELRRRLDDIERRLAGHDEKFVAVFDMIRQLMDEPEPPPKPPIGFETEGKDPKQLGRR